MDWLHKDLTAEFKVILTGENFPAEFQAGDRLALGNFYPEDGDYILLKQADGQHRIHRFHEDRPEVIEGDSLIGTIDTFTRDCGDWGLFLGDDAGRQYVPKMCTGCQRIEVVECAGQAGAYCLTETGLQRVQEWSCYREAKGGIATDTSKAWG